MRWTTLFKLILVILTVSIITFIMKRSSKSNSTAYQTTLIVGANAEYPPYSFIKDDVITGFDIDLASAVFNLLQKKIEIKDMQFSALISHAISGRIALIAGGFSKNDERASELLFSNTYHTNDPLVLVTRGKKSSIKTINDLTGKKVVVNEGYTADSFISVLPGPIITRAKSIAQAIDLLKNGDVDVFVTARSSFFATLPSPEQTNFTVVDIPKTNEAYAFAISPKYPELVEKINTILEQLESNGKLTILKKKWGLI